MFDILMDEISRSIPIQWICFN